MPTGPRFTGTGSGSPDESGWSLRSLAGDPGHGAARQVLGGEPCSHEGVCGHRRATSRVTGDHDGSVGRYFVDSVAELAQGNVDRLRVRPLGHLFALSHVEQEDVLAASADVPGLLGLD